MNDLYFSNPLIGSGLPVLSKNGAIAKQRLIDHIGKLLLECGYVPLASPHIGNLKLFEKSGHYPFYKDSMFPPIEGDDEEYVLKPMNCPFHIMAYENMGLVSYKELPVKFYEFGQVYRHEDSGALNGLFRLRSFMQDDGHIFCSENQIEMVVAECLDLIDILCDEFGLELKAKLSMRNIGDDQSKYIGKEESWNYSESLLSAICGGYFGKDFVIERGGAAFYGPKIDFVAKDKLGREWQLGTVQLDFNLPERFDINYVNSEGKNERPVLIHRALVGSLERFLGILLENDLLPLYLQPFNMGVVYIIKHGENEVPDYLCSCVKRFNNIGIYPSVIKNPKNLSEAMSQLYAKGISNIVIIGKKEEAENSINFNKENYSLLSFFDKMEEMFNINK